MKRLALSTAIVLGLGAACVSNGLAEDHDRMFNPKTMRHDLSAAKLIGMRVYVPESVNKDLPEVAGLNDGWNDVGEIDDLIVSRDGRVRAVVVDIGGFLGMNEKPIAIDMKALRFVNDSSTKDDPDDFFVAIATTADRLENLPRFEGKSRQKDKHSAKERGTKPGYVTLAHDEVTAEDITGARVYDARDQWIGEVSELIVDTDGELQKAVIDVGGFLGIGEKPVALPMEKVRILRKSDGSDIRVYVDLSKKELEAMPTWKR